MRTDFQLGEWLVRPQRDCIERGERIVHVKPKSMAVLVRLAQHAGEVVTRDEFLLEVWKYPTASVETRTVDNTLAALRKKIETNPADPQIIKTVRGKGYRWGA